MAKKKVEQKNGGPEVPSNFTDDQLQALFFQHKSMYERMLAAKKKAQAEFLNCTKLAKAELGKHAVSQIKISIKLDTEEGEAEVRAEIEHRLQIAKWMGASVGTQFEFFDGPDRTPAVDRAYAAGKRAGLKGEPRKPPHAPEVPQYKSWMDGYSEGNAAMASTGFKAPPAELHS